MNACDLAGKQCVPCRGDVPPLAGEALQKLEGQLGGGWQVVDERRLESDL